MLHYALCKMCYDMLDRHFCYILKCNTAHNTCHLFYNIQTKAIQYRDLFYVCMYLCIILRYTMYVLYKQIFMFYSTSQPSS